MSCEDEDDGLELRDDVVPVVASSTSVQAARTRGPKPRANGANRSTAAADHSLQT